MDQNLSPEVDPQVDNSPVAEKLSFTLEEWEAELAEAERKGYLKGRNSRIQQLRAQPEFLKTPPLQLSSSVWHPLPSFLANRRPSVWE